jgi:hypothetical protein
MLDVYRGYSRTSTSGTKQPWVVTLAEGKRFSRRREWGCSERRVTGGSHAERLFTLHQRGHGLEHQKSDPLLIKVRARRDNAAGSEDGRVTSP